MKTTKNKNMNKPIKQSKRRPCKSTRMRILMSADSIIDEVVTELKANYGLLKFSPSSPLKDQPVDSKDDNYYDPKFNFKFKTHGKKDMRIVNIMHGIHSSASEFNLAFAHKDMHIEREEIVKDICVYLSDKDWDDNVSNY